MKAVVDSLKRAVEPRITLGTIVELIVLFFALGATYRDLTVAQTHLAQQMVAIATDIRQMQTEYVRVDVQSVEQRRMEDRISEILARLERIERGLSR